MSETNGGGTALGRDAILAAGRVKTITVEAFGGTIHVRQLDAAGLIEIQERQDGNNVKAMALWVVGSVVDANDQKLFTFDDVPAIMALAIADVSIVADEVVRLNNLDKKTAENVIKNSGAQTTASASV